MLLQRGRDQADQVYPPFHLTRSPTTGADIQETYGARYTRNFKSASEGSMYTNPSD